MLYVVARFLSEKLLKILDETHTMIIVSHAGKTVLLSSRQQGIDNYDFSIIISIVCLRDSLHWIVRTLRNVA